MTKKPKKGGVSFELEDDAEDLMRQAFEDARPTDKHKDRPGSDLDIRSNRARPQKRSVDSFDLDLHG